MVFTPVKRAKVSEQVAASIRDAIVGGAYGIGDALPAERELAQQFGVNRSSVREAMHRLEAWGLVEVRHGSGARVVDFLATAGLQLLPFLVAPGGKLDGHLLGDLLELRVELLGWTAARAASRAEPAGVARLAELLAALEEASSAEALQTLDYDFFEQLVAMSHNRVLTLLSNAIRRVYLGQRALFVGMYADGVALRFHRRALAAIRAGDAVTARAAMAEYGATFIARSRS